MVIMTTVETVVVIWPQLIRDKQKRTSIFCNSGYMVTV